MSRRLLVKTALEHSVWRHSSGSMLHGPLAWLLPVSLACLRNQLAALPNADVCTLLSPRLIASCWILLRVLGIYAYPNAETQSQSLLSLRVCCFPRFSRGSSYSPRHHGPQSRSCSSHPAKISAGTMCNSAEYA